MASNGLINRAKTGTCRMCLRRRNVDKYLKTVGEVRRGYATGHIWECVDVQDCQGVALEKLRGNSISIVQRGKIQSAQNSGRLEHYIITT